MLIYALLIDDPRYGVTLRLYDTDLNANIAMLAYCRQKWQPWFGTLPDEPGDVISFYRDLTGTRWYVEQTDNQILSEAEPG